MTDRPRVSVVARRTRLALAAIVSLACFASQASAQAEPTTRPAKPHVIVVSIDGLRPDCMLRADTPTLRGLMNEGSFSLWATTTDVAITTPSHVSMMTGVTPERHGIAFNGDPPAGARILVPTLFDRAKDAGLSTALVSGKRKFDLFTFTNHVDFEWISKESSDKNEEVVADHAIAILRDHKPDFMLLHFPSADGAGHGIGWGTPQQIETIGKIDKAFGRVIAELKGNGLWESTYVIVSADHGGTVRSHGKDDPRSRYIPWICTGPGVRKNFDLTRVGKEYQVRTFDTFATACTLLGLSVPTDIDGKPVEPIFADQDLLRSADAPLPKGVVDPATVAYQTTQPAQPATPTVDAATQPTTAPAN